MAKGKKQQPDLTSIFSKTDTGQDEQQDKVTPRGIGLKQSEWDELEEIAHSLGSNRHQLAAWAVRDFLARWRTGEIKPQVETRKTLPGLESDKRTKDR